jgi:hypothetical protein
MNLSKNIKWLPLDLDALEDPKIMALTAELGMEGYGIYIMIIQYLAKQGPEYSLSLDYMKLLAYRNHISEEKIKAVVGHFNLFETDDNRFYSNSLLQRMKSYDERCEKNRKKALKRWDKLPHKNATALPQHYNSKAPAMQNRIEENIIEEKRDKNINTEFKNSETSSSIVLNNDENSKREYSNEIEELYTRIIDFFPEDVKPKTMKQKSDWCDTLDKLIRIDGNKPECIEKVIKYARLDDFWKSNFLSILKLRKKNKEDIMYFVVFEQQMKNKINPKDKNVIEGRYKRVNKYWRGKDNERDYTKPSNF